MKEEKKKNLLWAQTMPDASFGLFPSSSPSPPFKTSKKRYLHILVSIKHERKKKRLTIGGVVGDRVVEEGGDA